MAICFINHKGSFYNYSDSVYRNICNEDEILILFKGQTVRTHLDEALTTTLPHFFYRSSSGKKYKYVGQSIARGRIVQQRGTDSVLKMEYKVNISNNIIPFDTEIEPFVKENGKRCFKKNCFTELGLTPVTRDMTPGVIKANTVQEREIINELIRLIQNVNEHLQ